MNQNLIFDEVAAAFEDWPPKMEEVFPLPPGISDELESICDGDTALFDDATLLLPPRWRFSISDIDTYVRMVSL